MLTVAVIVPTVVFADSEPANTAEDIIYFLNPTAITTVGDYLFVADKIEDNRSAILCFDIANDSPVYKYTHEVDGNVTNLAAKSNSELYAILSDKIVELSVGNSLTETNSWNVANAVDVAYCVDILASEGKTEYILKVEELVRNNVSGNIVTFTNGIACVAIDNNVYYLYEDNSNIYCKNYDGNQHTHPKNGLNNAQPTDPTYYLTSFAPKGMFVWEGDKVTLFDDSLIRYIKFDEETCSLLTLLNYTSAGNINPENASIEDVATHNNRLYILNDKNKIEVYKNVETNGFELVATIGSDEVQQNVPTANDYTSFTLVRAKGYPANIVFKTTGENSLADIETEATEYIVIGYDGASASHFYYVFVRDVNGNYKFGWVKKSDNAESLGDDDKLEVVNTNWSNDSNVQYKTSFTTLNAVYIYDVPCSQYQGHTFTQTASNRTEVTVWQQFEEINSDGNITWLYVSYKDGETTKTGFVRNTDVGKFSIHVENTKIIADCKINSTLFSSVRVYMFNDPDKMTDDNIAVFRVPTVQKDENGNDVTVYVEEAVPPLYSGHRVSVISEENGIALIQIIRKSDNAVAFGYVYSNQLIGVDEITTNAAVGLTLLTIAIVLAVVLIVVYVQRRKKKSVKADRPRKEKD